jgi:uncharacterized protein YbdZ (MbtH family)
MCFAKVISINNQLKYNKNNRKTSLQFFITDWINMQPLDLTDSVHGVF